MSSERLPEAKCKHPAASAKWFNLRSEHAAIWCSECGSMLINGGPWQAPTRRPSEPFPWRDTDRRVRGCLRKAVELYDEFGFEGPADTLAAVLGEHVEAWRRLLDDDHRSETAKDSDVQPSRGLAAPDVSASVPGSAGEPSGRAQASLQDPGREADGHPPRDPALSPEVDFVTGLTEACPCGRPAAYPSDERCPAWCGTECPARHFTHENRRRESPSVYTAEDINRTYRGAIEECAMLCEKLMPPLDDGADEWADRYAEVCHELAMRMRELRTAKVKP